MTDLMQLEDQVCTQEQGKKIAELFGDNAPKSYFVWAYTKTGQDEKLRWVNKKLKWRIAPRNASYEGERICPAYSCAELGALLPATHEYLDKRGNKARASLFIFKIKSPEFVGFSSGYASAAVFGMSKIIVCRNKFEAHAKADLAIHLLEKKS